MSQEILRTEVDAYEREQVTATVEDLRSVIEDEAGMVAARGAAAGSLWLPPNTLSSILRSDGRYVFKNADVTVSEIEDPLENMYSLHGRGLRPESGTFVKTATSDLNELLRERVTRGFRLDYLMGHGSKELPVSTEVYLMPVTHSERESLDGKRLVSFNTHTYQHPIRRVATRPAVSQEGSDAGISIANRPAVGRVRQGRMMSGSGAAGSRPR